MLADFQPDNGIKACAKDIDPKILLNKEGAFCLWSGKADQGPRPSQTARLLTVGASHVISSEPIR